MSNVTVERMQSLYNFNRFMQIARKAEMESSRTKRLTLFLYTALLILIFLGISVTYYLKYIKNKTINKQIKEIEKLQSIIDILDDNKPKSAKEILQPKA